MVAQQCECTNGHQIVRFKMVSCMLCEFHLSQNTHTHMHMNTHTEGGAGKDRGDKRESTRLEVYI